MWARSARSVVARCLARARINRLDSRFGVLVAAAILVFALGAGLVVAHWALGIGVSIGAETGTVDASVSGDLAFDFPGCTPGAAAETCDKFDSNVIETAPLSHTADGASFTVTGWVYKGGDSAEPVGFYYTVTGGTVEIRVKSGRNYDEETLAAGSGYWLNPACTGDPGPGGSVTCTPRNTRAISHIAFCIVVVTPPTCPPPLMQTVAASNVGSIPFGLKVWLEGPAAGGADYCGVFDLTIHRLVGGNPLEPPLYEAPLCDLVGAPILLADQLDPGGSAEYKLTLSFSTPTSAFNGTSGSFAAKFAATQWNDPGGWTDLVDLPVMISVGPAPPMAVSAGSLPAVAPATIPTATVAADMNAPLPAVVDVLGRSTVTIISWAIDPVSSAKLGFDFTVSGDPVYVEVRRGTNVWVDERWGDENPHSWHDPYGVGSRQATPITSIEFGLVQLPEEPPAEEPPAAEPPAAEPPRNHPPRNHPPRNRPR